ncbi:class I poly(R)-hydroxyalkanoic acid synthase [Tianweitania sp. BSSL-BM11]|uniref:Class I poly(R)-hydroxyalkanoic acid synthase n=1 Tax=Tianweitania aestuarii TaxID=2814886 RepID=A0ABS5RUF4_9HYPH|nr:class I poly(R)-hydroxyalkanoic acid synthase [Tianweitania aestuarii]MBS9720641.1 class I poly(R)-hydroxyalkanoic acid synthase [Tianweitania aestuarii]
MTERPERSETENTGGAAGFKPFDQASVDPFLIKNPEHFALNLARMIEEAGKAAAAWAGPRERGELPPASGEPMSDMVRTFSKVTEYWLAEPSRAFEAQTKLFAGFMGIWANSLQKLNDAATPDIVPLDERDKRFQDPDWSRHAFFDFLKQAYFILSRWAADLVDQAADLDPATRQKANFYVKQIASAISPSNFVLTNPELFRETVASNGENLVRGMRMLAEDIAAGRGELKLRQSDAKQFRVGENIATTEGSVIARNDLAEIIQYAPSTDTVLKRPLLIVPPWINKFYILDLNPQKSFIRWAIGQGHTVFVISWVNPDERHAELGWEDYIRDGIQLGLDQVEQATGEREVNAIGYCVGGTLLAAALAQQAQEGDNRIRSATFFTTQVDFTHAGDLKVFVDPEQIMAVEAAMNARGFLDGTKMATAFNMLRAGDLIWPYVVNNYLRGKEPLPFDLLYWNSDSTRMTAANHSFYLRNCYLDNRLSRGEMKLNGRTLSLQDITIPVYNLATREDHIAPARSVFEGSQFFGGPVDYVMAGSGHIAGVVNPPAANKYQFWTGDKPAGAFDDWVARAEPHAGSWWPHWHAWIEQRDDARVAARKPGTSTPILGAAPGTYVHGKD